MADPQPDPLVESTIAYFSTIYLGGIPPIITHDSAYLSLRYVLCAAEALGGFRYAATIPKDRVGERDRQPMGRRLQDTEPNPEEESQ